jgi:biopolymer transport protein ExbD
MRPGRNRLSFLDEFDRELEGDEGGGDGPAVQIDLTPAIDVLFSILAFFIVATLFFSRLRGLPVNLPEAATAPIAPIAPTTLTVTIDRGGTVSVEGRSLSLEALVTLARSRQTQTPAQPIQAIIAADRDTPHGRVVAVMDALRPVPNLRLAIATEPAR